MICWDERMESPRWQQVARNGQPFTHSDSLLSNTSGVLIYREIDYVAEAANAQRFNELYAGEKNIFVPKIYSDLTTSKVLTMEWVDGVRLTDKASLAEYNLDPSKLVDTLVQSSMRQILGKLLSV
jgi:predicted unusual protein kinase regulating ubiquinone biosynthesis (AarF/ABC1/UbiB family)